MKSSHMTMLAATKHKGTSVVECLVNCVIFHDGAHKYLLKRPTVRTEPLCWNTENDFWKIVIKAWFWKEI